MKPQLFICQKVRCYRSAPEVFPVIWSEYYRLYDQTEELAIVSKADLLKLMEEDGYVNSFGDKYIYLRDLIEGIFQKSLENHDIKSSNPKEEAVMPSDKGKEKGKGKGLDKDKGEGDAALSARMDAFEARLSALESASSPVTPA